MIFQCSIARLKTEWELINVKVGGRLKANFELCRSGELSYVSTGLLYSCGFRQDTWVTGGYRGHLLVFRKYQRKCKQKQRCTVHSRAWLCIHVCLCFEIDLLVNNAGRTQRAWVIDTPLQIDREMIDLNVVGPISLTKCVLPHMIARRHGYILVTSSVIGKLRKPSLIAQN